MRLEALKSEQRKIFEKLKYFPEFYLVGGTALALQIGHRISVDFDLFTAKKIPAELLDKVKRIFKEFKIKIIINHSEQLGVKINEIKVDFVKYTFPLVLNLTEFMGVKIAAVAEIAAMKAHVLDRRGTLKDYIDLFFILKDKHSTIEETRKIAEKKYKDEFNFRLFLEQLVYLGDIREEKIQFLKKPVKKADMLEFFKKEIGNIKI